MGHCGDDVLKETAHVVCLPEFLLLLKMSFNPQMTVVFTFLIANAPLPAYESDCQCIFKWRTQTANSNISPSTAISVTARNTNKFNLRKINKFDLRIAERASFFAHDIGTVRGKKKLESDK